MEWPRNKVEKEMPRVVLHFMRHSIKEKAPEKSDVDILLSEAGRELAVKKFDHPVDMRFAHAVGSPRIRTYETAVVAATKSTTMDPGDIGIGKVRVSEALDFVVNESDEYGRRLYEAFEAGKYLSFLLNESDALAREKRDTSSSTYSRMAANIAGIIYRNFEVASRGARQLEKSNSESKKNDFRRILATHGGIQESFLLKVVEKTKGIEDRDRLLSLMGGNGFDFIEGFDAILSKENDGEKIRITYKKGEYVFDEIVSPDIIREILEEGRE